MGRTRADLLRRMRRFREKHPAPARTPGAAARLVQEFEEWAPLRQAVNSSMFEDWTDEPLHEVECPNCGATIRARMADRTAESD